MEADMKALLRKFEGQAPEIVLEWNDRLTDAKGWVVINSLRGGAAGGGTRMRKGLNKHEVVSLAKTMEVKFTVSGPEIGGAKSGIDFDPNDPRKNEVLQRWYKAVIPQLKNYYGTGGDMNVDEIEEVIPITQAYGLWHPQEGIVQGHYQPSERDRIIKLGQLRQGVSKVVEDARFTPSLDRKYTVADLITGYGVSESVRHYYELWGGSLEGKRAVIQGWGNVGAAAGFYLAQAGAKVVGVIDGTGGVINTEGYTLAEVTRLMLRREKRRLAAPDLVPFAEADEKLWNVPAEIFVPCAGSRLVGRRNLEPMIANGLEVISCGANVPFDNPDIFYGDVAAFADGQVAVIPDFIANCGMARVFAYLMRSEVELTDRAIFADTSRVIGEALEAVHAAKPEPTGLSEAALRIALDKIVREAETVATPVANVVTEATA